MQTGNLTDSTQPNINKWTLQTGWPQPAIVCNSKRNQDIKKNKLKKAISEGRIGYFVCPCMCPQLAANTVSRLKNELNLTCNNLATIPELFTILANPTNQIDILWIDAEAISTYKGSNYIDIINTIITLLNATNRTNRTHTSIVIGKATPVELIKEIIKLKDVNSMSPRIGDFSYDEVRQTCVNIMQGKNFIPASIKRLLKAKKARRNSNLLTIRQKQIFTLIKEEGDSNKVIARKLKITESAVKRHVSEILRKTNKKNRTQLALIKDSN